MKRGVKVFTGILALLLAFIFTFTGCQPAKVGEKPADFYKGKTITIIVPYNPGGGYDTQSRITAPYLAKYTGAANVVINNMPGAGGMKGMNYLYTTADPDGLTLATFPADTAGMNQLLGRKEVKYELDKFSWIGSYYRDDPVIVLGEKVPHATPKDLAGLKEFKMATARLVSGMTLNMVIFANAFDLDNMILVSGYDSTPEMALSIARGETHGTSSGLGTMRRLVAKEGGTLLYTLLARERSALEPEVPTIFELAEKAGQPLTGDKAKWVDIRSAWMNLQRPLTAPPNIPKDRLEFLRDAFMKILADKEWQSEWQKAKYPLANPLRGDKLQEASGLVKVSDADMKAFKYMLTEKYIK